MKYLASNLKYLRAEYLLSQKKLGERIKISASSIGSYEHEKSVPSLRNMQKLAATFDVGIDTLLHVDLSKDKREQSKDGRNIRVLPIVVASDNNEKASIVPAQAAAGYTEGYAQPEFVSNLMNFDLPFPELQKEQTYRVFQITGDSMLPIKNKSYIITSYLQNWADVKYGSPYIILTKEDGIVFKRIEKSESDQRLRMISDNKQYEPFEVHVNDVQEIWIAKGVIDFDMN
ncbi:helix-turn-helix domain-containing protein [Prolixibacteraceae bacterium]|nr:helix-turn-helix domain-containing protein [Prolixibacteraceae bacterium]